jgi:hypothetical protein
VPPPAAARPRRRPPRPAGRRRAFVACGRGATPRAPMLARVFPAAASRRSGADARRAGMRAALASATRLSARDRDGPRRRRRRRSRPKRAPREQPRRTMLPRAQTGVPAVGQRRAATAPRNAGSARVLLRRAGTRPRRPPVHPCGAARALRRREAQLHTWRLGHDRWASRRGRARAGCGCAAVGSRQLRGAALGVAAGTRLRCALAAPHLRRKFAWLWLVGVRTRAAGFAARHTRRARPNLRAHGRRAPPRARRNGRAPPQRTTKRRGKTCVLRCS